LTFSLRFIIPSIFSGVLSGASAALFLIVLNWATETRLNHPQIIWLLPVAGFFLGWLYFRFGKDVAGGNNLVLEQIHSPKKILPLVMAPLIFIGTVLTHLFGGSAGREGTAVQMAASLSDQLSKIFKLSPQERTLLLKAGAGAGFGAAIGTPLAGIVFGLEFIHIGRIRFNGLLECALASFIATLTCHALGAPHTLFPHPVLPSFSLLLVSWVALAGVLFGLTALLFAQSVHYLERTLHKLISYSPFKPFLGGIVLVLLFLWEGSYKYAGLGLSVIQEALQEPGKLRDSLLKFLFSILTLASGFKGGEFVPLVFIGSTLGSALSQWIPVPFDLLGAVGFAGVFGAASNTPLACALMAMELFGWGTAPYALTACWTAYLFSGHRGIYSGQPTLLSKKRQAFPWLE